MSLFFLQRTDDLGEVLVGTFTTRELAEEHIVAVESKAVINALNLHESMMPYLLAGKFPMEDISRAQEFLAGPAPKDGLLSAVHGILNATVAQSKSSMQSMRHAFDMAVVAFKLKLAEARRKYRIEEVG